MKLHPAERYARDVITGKIPACQYVIRACQRYFDDLEHAHERGLEFRRDKAQESIDFYQLFTHYEGEKVGQQLVAEPFQQFIMWNLYGWYRAEHERWRIKNYDGQIENTAGTRRYRQAYIEIPRKNAKTYFGAINGNKIAFAEGYNGQEVYSCATKRDQAKICWNTAKLLIENSPTMGEFSGVETLKNNMNQAHTYSKFEPLSSESRTLDGLRIAGGILDEVHAWKSRDVYTKILRGTSSKPEPLIIMITTAGSFEESKFCWEIREYSCKVLDRVIDDPTWFAIIYTIDKDDDWRDEISWIKANPGLFSIKKMDYMRTEALKAAEMPTALNDFLRYELNVWVRSDAKWMPMDHWRLCTGPVPAPQLPAFLLGRPCYAGLDIASESDLTALALEFPPIDVEKDPLYYVFVHFFVPEGNIEKRTRLHNVPYVTWADQGYITPTPGDYIDQEFILSHLDNIRKNYDLRQLRYDRWGSQGVMGTLQNQYGFMTEPEKARQFRKPLLVLFGQGYVSMNAPMKDLLRVVLLHQLAHGNNPVLTWNADNLIARMDPAGNIKPDKEKSNEKIDGMTALIMAHAGAMTHNAEPSQSVYAERGLLTL